MGFPFPVKCYLNDLCELRLHRDENMADKIEKNICVLMLESIM